MKKCRPVRSFVNTQLQSVSRQRSDYEKLSCLFKTTKVCFALNGPKKQTKTRISPFILRVIWCHEKLHLSFAVQPAANSGHSNKHVELWIQSKIFFKQAIGLESKLSLIKVLIEGSNMTDEENSLIKASKVKGLKKIRKTEGKESIKRELNNGRDKRIQKA